MNMNIKKLVYPLSMASLLASTALVYFWSSDHSRTHVKTTDLSVYEEQLVSMERDAWQHLGSLGISKEQCLQDAQEGYERYLRSSKHIVGPRELQNPAVRTMVNQILTEFAIEPESITIAVWGGHSPASAGDYFININPDLLLDLAEPAQKFVIAHEVQHILNKDHSTDFFVYQYLDKADWHKELPAKHPLMHYYRFREQRADMQAAMKSKEWAERYKAYAQEIMDKAGDTNDPAHPKNSERLRIAQNIVQEMNTQIA